ncbi:OmpA family protein [Luteimonas sp. SJ-92]|uniref:OmpA family protein n=1 Tax=Luteimonas salinisoli TaxID=2752307 RepID=A0A853JI16_9GAMM|nr:OmpA family protein [Luteimonas salinisoli]NZA28384.1 OmpA family protein [Luteimonas salinisoli]
MIRATALVAGTLLLAACSQPPSSPPAAADSPQAAEAADRDRTGTTAPDTPAATSAAPSAPGAAGSALTGGVSGLSGDVSSLEARVGALGGTITEHEIVVPLPADTLFDFDRAEIRPQAEPGLRQLAQLLAQTEGIAQVGGHTDAKGDDEYNLALSQRRADAVVAWLVGEGAVPASRLQARGFGEAQPVAPNTTADGADDPAGRARNRRVEVVIAR